MTRFSQCPRCAARGADRHRDNLAEYAESFYCFACGYHKRKRDVAWVKRQVQGDTMPPDSVKLTDVSSMLPDVAIKWLMKYKLTPDEIKTFKWHNLGLVLVNTDQFYQVRTFVEGMPKYLSKGKKPFITYGSNPDDFVFVEDVISAIKVGRIATASPMFGTMPDKRILRHLQGFKNVFIATDRDATIKSLKTARNLSEILGKPIKPVILQKDPKSYTTEELQEIFKLF